MLTAKFEKSMESMNRQRTGNLVTRIFYENLLRTVFRLASAVSRKSMTLTNAIKIGYLSNPNFFKIFPHAVCRHARAAQKVC